MYFPFTFQFMSAILFFTFWLIFKLWSDNSKYFLKKTTTHFHRLYYSQSIVSYKSKKHAYFKTSLECFLHTKKYQIAECFQQRTSGHSVYVQEERMRKPSFRYTLSSSWPLRNPTPSAFTLVNIIPPGAWIRFSQLSFCPVIK